MPSSDVPNYALALGVVGVLLLIIILAHSNRRLRAENAELRKEHRTLLVRAVTAEHELAERVMKAARTRIAERQNKKR